MSTLFSLLFIIIIIIPALIILLDFDLVIIPPYIIYSLGLQWAWQSNIIINNNNNNYNIELYCDHHIISSVNKKINNNYNTWIKSYSKSNNIIIRYLFDISQYPLLTPYSFIRSLVYSFDATHSIGSYSRGIKIDAIPGRINLAITPRLLRRGEYRGKCFELCGQGHLSMMINSIILNIKETII